MKLHRKACGKSILQRKYLAQSLLKFLTGCTVLDLSLTDQQTTTLHQKGKSGIFKVHLLILKKQTVVLKKVSPSSDSRGGGGKVF